MTVTDNNPTPWVSPSTRAIFADAAEDIAMRREGSYIAEAEHAIEERMAHYGHPRDNHARTVSFWNTFLGHKLRADAVITVRDVCMLNALQKVARDINLPYRDNPVDIVGWMENIQLADTIQEDLDPLEPEVHIAQDLEDEG